MENLETNDGVGAAGTEEQAGDQGAETQDNAPEKKYTDADVDKIIAKKIAAERKKMTKLLEQGQLETDIEVRERNVLQREIRLDMKERFRADNLPEALADLLNFTSAEEAEEGYDKVTKIFKEAFRQACAEKFKGHAPRRGAMEPGDTDGKIKSIFSPDAR